MDPEDSLQQVCSEKDLARVAQQLNTWEGVYPFLDVAESYATTIKRNYSDFAVQKVEILKAWKRKKGISATYKSLSDVFLGDMNDQDMADNIKRLADRAYQEEPCVNLVLEFIDKLDELPLNILLTAADNAGIPSDRYMEALEDAASDSHKKEVINSAVLPAITKKQLILFLRNLQNNDMVQSIFQKGDQSSIPLQLLSSGMVSARLPGTGADVKSDKLYIKKQFICTVENIKTHLERCKVQVKELAARFNMTVDDSHDQHNPHITSKVKRKLLKCKSIGDLFMQLTPFYSWCNRDVLRTLVAVSGCQEAERELDQFEVQLLPERLIMHCPLPMPSHNICTYSNSDTIVVAIKANKPLIEITYGEAENFRSITAEKGGVKANALQMLAGSSSSSIIYWLIPKNLVKTFEKNIRDSLDFLYEKGIVEVSLDPNIVITTGRKLRVRSLAYLTKIPDKIPERAEELQELLSQAEEVPGRGEEILEFAQQLQKDVKQRVKEIEELKTNIEVKNKIVEDLQQDNIKKEQECEQLRKHLDQSTQENIKLKQSIEVVAQPRDQEEVFASAPPKRGFQCQQGVDLVFGTRGHTAVKCGDKVYIGGGVTTNADGAAPNLVQVNHLQDNNVSSLPACPVKHFSLVAINGRVVTVGGRNMSDDSVSDKLYSWNETSRQWEESLPHMPTPRYLNTSVVWQEFLITCGGRIDDEGSITNCVEVLNLQTLHWRTASPMLLKESGKHAVVTECDKLYLLGGYLGNAVHYCQLPSLVLSMPTRQDDMWKRLRDTPSDDCAATLLDGSLVIIGGCSAGTNEICSMVQCYAQDTWQPVGDLSCGRTACVAVQLGHNDALVIGGTVSRDRPEWFSKSTEKITL